MLLTLTILVTLDIPQPSVGLVMSLCLSAFFSTTLSWILCSLVADVAQARVLLRRLAHFDALTGAHSRPYFMAAAAALLARPGPVVVALLDVDDFKRINDRHGHHTGDQVLRAVSDACRAALRPGDLFARHGGEEFAVVLPGLTAQQAIPVVERMRLAVAALSLSAPAGEPIRVTASFGIAGGDLLPSRVSGSAAAGALALQQTLAAADGALYRAKRHGKNRICLELEAAARVAA